MKGLKFLIFMLPLLLATFVAQAHNMHDPSSGGEPMSLEEKCEKADYIIEGKLLSAEVCLRDENDLNSTYTLRTVEVYKVFKGDSIPDTLQLVTRGGYLEITNEYGGYYGSNPLFNDAIAKNCLFFMENSRQSFYELSATIPEYEAFIYLKDFRKLNDIGKCVVEERLRKQYFNKIETFVNRKCIIFKENCKKKALTGNKSASTGTITSFNNNVPAGLQNNNSLLVIQGNGFGSNQGDVGFVSANNNGNFFAPSGHIQTWTDNLIEVWIPSIDDLSDISKVAASGLFYIETFSGEIISSPSAIEIPYSVVNSDPSKRFKFLNFFNQAFKARYDTSIYNNPQALAVIRVALEIWRCETGIDVIEACPSDAICETMPRQTFLDFSFTNSCITYSDPANLALTHWEFTTTPSIDYSYYTQSGCLISFGHPNSVNWDFSLTATTDDTKYSFLHAVLHELGHFFGLNHARNQTIMYYDLDKGDTTYSAMGDTIFNAINLNGDPAINGVNEVMQYSSTNVTDPSNASSPLIVPLADCALDTCAFDLCGASFSNFPITITPACSNADGSITVNVGTLINDAIYDIVNSTNDTIHSFTGGTAQPSYSLAADTYVAHISDVFGCYGTDTFMVEDGSITLPLVNITNVSNPFVADGMITINEPNNAYNYTIVDLAIEEEIGEFLAGSIPVPIIVGELCAGEYELTITNDLGCTYTEIYIIEAGGKSPEEILDGVVSTQCSYSGDEWLNPSDAPIICLGTTLDFDFSEFVDDGYEGPTSEYAVIEQDEDNPDVYHIYWFVPGLHEVSIETSAEACGGAVTYSWYVNVELEDCGVAFEVEYSDIYCPPNSSVSGAISTEMEFTYTLPIDSPRFGNYSSPYLPYLPNLHPLTFSVNDSYAEGQTIRTFLAVGIGHEYFYMTNENGCGSNGLSYPDECGNPNCDEFIVDFTALQGENVICVGSSPIIDIIMYGGTSPFVYTPRPDLSTNIPSLSFSSDTHYGAVHSLDANFSLNDVNDIAVFEISDVNGCTALLEISGIDCSVGTGGGGNQDIDCSDFGYEAPVFSSTMENSYSTCVNTEVCISYSIASAISNLKDVYVLNHPEIEHSFNYNGELCWIANDWQVGVNELILVARDENEECMGVTMYPVTIEVLPALDVLEEPQLLVCSGDEFNLGSMIDGAVLWDVSLPEGVYGVAVGTQNLDALYSPNPYQAINQVLYNSNEFAEKVTYALFVENHNTSCTGTYYIDVIVMPMDAEGCDFGYDKACQSEAFAMLNADLICPRPARGGGRPVRPSVDGNSGSIGGNPDIGLSGPSLSLPVVVCGCNGVEYASACLAKKDGVSSWTNGKCATIVGPIDIGIDINHEYNLINCKGCIGIDWEADNGDIAQSYVDPRTRTDINWNENAQTGIVRARAMQEGVERVIELEVDINLKSIIGMLDDTNEDGLDIGDFNNGNGGSDAGDGASCDAISELLIYPNPVDAFGVLEFYLSEVAMVSATVVNIDGVVVHTFYDNAILMPGTKVQKFRGSKFNPGIYYLQIAVDGCEPQTVSFVVI